MTDTDTALIASLKGFTPGPHQVAGARHKGDLKIGKDARLLMVGPDGDPCAAVFFDMQTGRGHNDAKLYAAAPDLHRIATEQAAEIERLREGAVNAVEREAQRLWWHMTEAEREGDAAGASFFRGRRDTANKISVDVRAALKGTT